MIGGSPLSESDSVAYVLGRELGQLREPYQAEDVVFGATRLDEKTIQEGDFKHCTFANVSFKAVQVQSSSFLNCVFIGCYFRRAHLVDTKFTGCRFIDCNFAHIRLQSAQFPYSSFLRCQLPFSELFNSLPSEPNVREALARNLFLESSRLGLSSDAHQYRRAEINAREDHLREAFLGRSKWYRDHFDTMARLTALGQLILSLLNRWLWGYGERVRVLVLNFLVAALLVFPIAFYFVRGGLVRSTGGEPSVWDLLFFSIENVVPAGIQSGVQAVAPCARILAGVESLFGVLVIALLASYILRWSLHR